MRENEVVVQLPESQRTLVVEAYLEPDSIYRVSVSRTQPYFEIPNPNDLVKLLVPDALVTISHQGKVDTLTYFPPITFAPDPRPTPGLFYVTGEYRLNKKIPANFTEPFKLNIRADGKNITAQTLIMPPVVIDSLYILYDNRQRASIRIIWQDPNPSKLNYYRFIADNGKADSLNHFVFSDRLLSSEKQILSTGYNYKAGDTVYVRLYHITEEYYNFYRSVSRAISANYNPLSEPTSIKSNVQGGAIGIFTGFSQTRKRVIIPR
ncbi:MAG: DUF4249 domain-containing protein [Bacteroidia bacterium]|nr:DUF4249 domain-containing protein [Bacteroidia bacterium]MDW8157849.1 DUF4249 domain-containing protein [Bacteroidia bacterium]